MFDFDTSKLSEEKIKEIADNNNMSFLSVAIKANGYKWSQKHWPEIVDVVELSDEEYVTFGKILKLAKTNKGVVGIRSLHDAVRKVKPFAGRANVMASVVDGIIPALEYHGFICFVDGRAYVNPRIIDAQSPEFIARNKGFTGCWHEKHTRAEWEKAMELWQLMKNLNKLVK